ncbi:MAG TPA: tetraacyldisaccharide 4'-kinase [Gammaproteobacteria bacterium]|nr:tetraacyldisaccharide 4'-kinase [Gammaproteobacteria bacterium]
MKAAIRRLIESSWQGRGLLSTALWPLSWPYQQLIKLCQRYYERFPALRYTAPVPVIVVGNLTVGGTGKTPLVLWLTTQLQARGLRPAIILRGYGGNSKFWPRLVTRKSTAELLGDEAILLSRRARVPVAVGPNRKQDIERLLAKTDCNIIIADDGLQHLALKASVEVGVVDGQRRFGNGRCLPAGPLRESAVRWPTLDFRVCNGGQPEGDEWAMTLRPEGCFRVADGTPSFTWQQLEGRVIHAVAGIGHPQRFFSQLSAHGVILYPHAFRDHHKYSAEDIVFTDDNPVIMTEKDAVKCQDLASENVHYLRVSAKLDERLADRIVEKINTFPIL